MTASSSKATALSKRHILSILLQVVVSASMLCNGFAQFNLSSDSDCIITTSTCPCSLQMSAGKCIRHQGHGLCLLQSCKNSYRCDCLGFEQCAISKCSKYVSMNAEAVKEKDAFKCHESRDVGSCVEFSGFLHTLSAARNAKVEASVSVRECGTEEVASSRAAIEILLYKKEIVDKLSEVDLLESRVSEEEHAELQKDVDSFLDSITEIITRITRISDEATEVFLADRKTAYWMRTAALHYGQADVKQEQLNEEMDKSENGDDCAQCDEVRAQAAKLRKESQNAVVLTGRWASTARTHNFLCQTLGTEVRALKARCMLARDSCVAKTEAILDRLRGA